MSYDDNNIFAKILRGEIPCLKKFMKMNMFYHFYDINPQKKIHKWLVIPKGKFIDLDDFARMRQIKEMVGFIKGVNKVAAKLGDNNG